MTLSGGLFFLVYLLIAWCTRKTLKTGLRLLWLKVTLFLYLVPFQLFKYLFPEWLWRSNWAKMDIYHLTENYIIYSHNDYIADMGVIFTWIWCIVSGVVAVIFTAFHLIRYLRMKRILSDSIVNVESGRQSEKLENIRKEIGLRKNVRFVFSEYFSSPFTFGYFSPIVVLPASMKDADEEQWDFMVRHELNHIKSKHMAVKFFALIANLVHFFNPFAYLLRHEIYSMCEIDCDSKTIESFDTEQRKKYGEYIVDTAIRSKELFAVGSIGLLGDKLRKGKIQRRILEMNQSKKKKGIVSIAVALTAVLIGSVSVYAYAPTIQLEFDYEVNSNPDLVIYDKVSDIPKFDLNSGDIFTDKNGNTYDTSGVDRAICFHSFTDAILGDHTLNSDGSCVTVFYDVKRCTKCGYVKDAVYNCTATFDICPH